MGFVLAALTILGWLLGRYLDEKLGTSPWLSLVGSLLGMSAGFFEVIVLAKRAEREDTGGKGQ
jgi:F0F1-type ATP synthase assembly protein I